MQSESGINRMKSDMHTLSPLLLSLVPPSLSMVSAVLRVLHRPHVIQSTGRQEVVLPFRRLLARLQSRTQSGNPCHSFLVCSGFQDSTQTQEWASKSVRKRL